MAGLVCVAVLFPALIHAERRTSITLNLDSVRNDVRIPAEIYGQFAEHLGTCIYGGLWVGENSDIPNEQGYRMDVLKALKDLKIPVIRWPGGCFADEYHWVDGIGPKTSRPSTVNANWGATIVEDNSFGTHEFFNLCEMLDCEPYLSGNVGSGSVEELSKWVEYITAEEGPMADLRKKNGREKPWKLKYLGVGNESWGCGGHFTPEAYSDEYKRYQTFCKDYNGNKLFKIASGANEFDTNWTKVLMEKARHNMDGLSVHYYTTSAGWDGDKGSATIFSDEDYYWTLGKTLEMERLITVHDSIMSGYDPGKRVALMVDEWGTWWNQEPGSIPGHLFQQNTMRDAIVAALNFNIFHDHVDRVRMANIAQLANVLQSMVLTSGDRMVLTPTYYAFKMYVPHQEALVVPLEVVTETHPAVGGFENIPVVSATASIKNGYVNITMTNTSLDQANEVMIKLPGYVVREKDIVGNVLTSDNITDFNDFGKPEKVGIQQFSAFSVQDGDGVVVTMPTKSIVNLSIPVGSLDLM